MLKEKSFVIKSKRLTEILFHGIIEVAWFHAFKIDLQIDF